MKRLDESFAMNLSAKMHDAVHSTSKVECANRWIEIAIIIIKSVARFTGDDELMKIAEKLENNPYIWLYGNDDLVD